MIIEVTADAIPSIYVGDPVVARRDGSGGVRHEEDTMFGGGCSKGNVGCYSLRLKKSERKRFHPAANLAICRGEGGGKRKNSVVDTVDVPW